MQEQLTQTNSHLTSQQKTENSELDLSLAGYDYELPTELIAQNPAVPRDSSRLLVVNSLNVGTEIAPQHRIFRDLPEILRPGDLLVMNNTRVIPARLYGEKLTGAEVEVLLLEERQHNLWLALVKPGKRFKHGSKIVFTAKDGREDREKEDAGTRGRGDAGTRGRGDAGTRGHGDAGTL
jgi:S-adenosylmethionine:tRNA ribosyltransferase-isomerase